MNAPENGVGSTIRATADTAGREATEKAARVIELRRQAALLEREVWTLELLHAIADRHLSATAPPRAALVVEDGGV